MYCYLPVFLGLFEPFRRDLTRSEGGYHFKYQGAYESTTFARRRRWVTLWSRAVVLQYFEFTIHSKDDDDYA